jgi:acyl-CoA synthetase (AMP-forming)/AMP-acid ligase II
MEQSFFLTRMLETLRDGGESTAFVHNGTEMTFGQALNSLRHLHAALAAEGVSAGEVVAVVAGNRPETILVQLAAQLRGATVLLVTASSSLPDRLAVLEAAGTGTLVIDPEREPGHARELVQSGQVPRVLCLGPVPPWMPEGTHDVLARQRDEQISVPRTVRLIFPTGGTTGTPKLIVHSGIYDGMAHIFAPDPADPGRTLLVAPMSHMTGNATVLGALLRRDIVVLHNGFDPGAVLRAIETQRITTLSLTPPRLAAVLDHPAMPGTDVSSVRSLSLGASPLSARRLRQALAAFGASVGQGYGLTEAPMIASIAAAELDGHPERLESVGRIVPGMEAKVTCGEIVVRGLSMMDGYLGRPPIGDGWLHTGDIGHFDADGYLYLLDRADDVILAGEHGTKVYSNVVENALVAHPGVSEAAVIGIPDVMGDGAVVHAVVVPTEPGVVSAEDLRTHALATFGQPHFVPSSVDFTDALPLTPIGKVDKKALRAPFWPGRESGSLT